MPGAEHYAIIRARLLADERAHRAAKLYVEAGIAVEATSLATVVGHVAMIAVWAFRETTNGVLPGDGVSTVMVATFADRATAEKSAKSLLDAGLLRKKTSGVYVVGFQDCYKTKFKKRKRDQARNKEVRANGEGQKRSGDVAATSRRRSGDVAATSPRRSDVEENRIEEKSSSLIKRTTTEGEPPALSGTGSLLPCDTNRPSLVVDPAVVAKFRAGMEEARKRREAEAELQAIAKATIESRSGKAS